MTDVSIVRLKMTIDANDPKVLRRIETRLSIRFDRLYLTIRAATIWTISRFYEVCALATSDGGIPGPNKVGGPQDTREAKLADVLEDVGVKTLRYQYIFGNAGKQTIKTARMDGPMPGVPYPQLT